MTDRGKTLIVASMVLGLGLLVCQVSDGIQQDQQPSTPTVEATPQTQPE